MLFQIEKYYNANKDSIYRSTVVSTIGLWIARQVTIRSTSRVNDSQFQLRTIQLILC